MAYFVKLMPRAKRDLTRLFAQIHAGESEAALRWYQNLQEEICSLEETPNRCPVTTERISLRHLLFGRKPHVYRVIYRVLEEKKQVDVLHIRHGARHRFRKSEI